MNFPSEAGARVCAAVIATDEDWSAIAPSTAGSPSSSIRRTTRYVIPAKQPTTVPGGFLDAGTFARITGPLGQFSGQPWHAAFAAVAAPGLAPATLFNGLDRTAYTGEIAEANVPILGTVYIYNVTDASSLSCAAQQRLHEEMLKRFKLAAPYRAAFGNVTASGIPAGCELATLTIASSDVAYEPYTQGTAFGLVRVYAAHQFQEAAAGNDFGWQNLLVLEEAPFDLETTIAGVVTGSRQGQLSHLNIRSAARGTPNCFVRAAQTRYPSWAEWALWDGKLARLSCGPDGVELAEATEAEVQEWRSGFRPSPKALMTPDYAATATPGLLALPTSTTEERSLAVSRYGAKGTNLATLYQRIPPALQLEGYLVPVSAYRSFLRTASVRIVLSTGEVNTTAEAFIPMMLTDPQFRADSRVRRTLLDQLRAALLATPCPRELLDYVAAGAAAWAGGQSKMWRFRSSSNAEDIPGFSGAGLYVSERGCFADDSDADTVGPSRCDPQGAKERPACDALRAVWASPWSLKAFEERDWYGIPHEQVAMGVLVNERSRDELVDIVAFSGDPNLRGDERYLIDAQADGLEVVAPDPGTWPETTRLVLQAGAVTTIERLRASSARSGGAPVLSNELLRQLGAAYWSLLQSFPQDDPVPPGREVIYDSEWKVLGDGRLVIKQIRPFLR